MQQQYHQQITLKYNLDKQDLQMHQVIQVVVVVHLQQELEQLKKK